MRHPARYGPSSGKEPAGLGVLGSLALARPLCAGCRGRGRRSADTLQGGGYGRFPPLRSVADHVNDLLSAPRSSTGVSAVRLLETRASCSLPKMGGISQHRLHRDGSAARITANGLAPASGDAQNLIISHRSWRRPHFPARYVHATERQAQAVLPLTPFSYLLVNSSVLARRPWASRCNDAP